MAIKPNVPAASDIPTTVGAVGLKRGAEFFHIIGPLL